MGRGWSVAVFSISRIKGAGFFGVGLVFGLLWGVDNWVLGAAMVLFVAVYLFRFGLWVDFLL